MKEVFVYGNEKMKKVLATTKEMEQQEVAAAFALRGANTEEACIELVAAGKKEFVERSLWSRIRRESMRLEKVKETEAIIEGKDKIQYLERALNAVRKIAAE